MLRLFRQPTGSKVPPRITVLFWIIKILTTAMGEAVSDYLVHGYNPYAAVLAGFVAFAIAILIQFRAVAYVPWIYWLAVLMVAVFGTMAADVLHVEFGVPYVASTVVFAVALVAIFEHVDRDKSDRENNRQGRTYGTPNSTCRTSAAIVPNTATISEASQ